MARPAGAILSGTWILNERPARAAQHLSIVIRRCSASRDSPSVSWSSCRDLTWLCFASFLFLYSSCVGTYRDGQKLIVQKLKVRTFDFQVYIATPGYIVSLHLKSSNICFNFYELKYLPGQFCKNCSTSPQNFGGLKGKRKKKALLYVKFCVSYQLVLQICKESETEPKF